MRIENLRIEKNGERLRTVANVFWEDCSRPAQELYFETNENFADSLTCNPHAFLVACTMPAMHFGEHRLSIEGEICPELKDGLMTVMNWMRFWWYNPSRRLVTIEGKTISEYPEQRISERAGVFFSGGIDALSTLVVNRMGYPLKHPGSIKDGLLVCGLEIPDPVIFKYVLDSLSVLAENANISLVPIFTNIRSLGPEDDKVFWGEFWRKEFMGATLAAIAHAFANRLTRVSINSSDVIPDIVPYGTHPLVDPCFSSSDLRIRHEGITLSRLEKTRMVSAWAPALQNLRVCNDAKLYQPGRLNCGKCEKCIRTMLTLKALGVLDKTTVFPDHDISVELIKANLTVEGDVIMHYPEIISALYEKGHHEIAQAIQGKLCEYKTRNNRIQLRRKLIEPIIKFDEEHFNGFIRNIKRNFYSKGIWN
jgi:hypothetical protein